MTERLQPFRTEFTSKRPTTRQIFDAKTSYDTTPDWDTQVLANADPKDLEKVDIVLQQGLPLGEAEILLEIYTKEV